jgi:acetyl-CoA C-acetyltransferase
MSDVAIIGVGQTPFVRRCGTSIQELCFEAFKEAIEDAQISAKEIDASIICSAPEYDKQRSPSGVISEYLGLTPPRPSFYCESVCSSSSTGLKVAWSFIESGLHEVVAVIGFQKMSEISSADVQERMGRGADIMWEAPFGTMMPAYYAMFARAYMHDYGLTEEQLALVRVKNAQYASLNPKAVYRKEVTLEQVLTSRVIASPLKMFDCCVNADGASCLILASKERASRAKTTPIWVAGIGAGTSSVNMARRESMTSFVSAREAAREAYEMAGVGPEDIDVAEVHDCFTIAEIIAYGDLGFCKPGEGPKLIEAKQTYLGGRIPVNLDGGLLSKGHPIGATGGSQIRTIVKQLRGEVGETQVEGAKIGLVHNIGGVGVYGNVTILKR